MPNTLHAVMNSLRIAPHACEACKAKKRRCDRRLPSCSLCSRNWRACTYPRSSGSKVSTGYTHPATQSLAVSRRFEHQQNSRTPQGFGDDPSLSVFKPTSLRQQYLSILVARDLMLPDYVAHHIGGAAEQHEISAHYFEVTHRWLPIVSKQKFHQDLTATTAPDVMLLLLGMKLIDWQPAPGTPQTALYKAAKRFFLDAELAGVMSLALLQAAVLIAFYELGHGMYPSAHISVGVCMRYSAVLGIRPQSESSSSRLSAEWVGEQELLRLWWALLLLDRFTNLCHPGQLPSIEGPKAEHMLPSDDRSWDQGTCGSLQQATVASPIKTQHSRFSLVAQAVVLLDKVLSHISHDNETKGSEDETVQLQRTIDAMLEFARFECIPRHLYRVFGCEVKAILYGALIALHDDAPDGSRSSAPDIALLVGSELAAVSWEESLHDSDVGRDKWPPFAVHIIHQAAVSLIKRKKNIGFTALQKLMQPFREALTIAQRRWLSAVVYLEDIDAQMMQLS